MRSRTPDTLSEWSAETTRDRRNTRWAIVVAVLVHALILRLQLPETAAAEPADSERPIHFLRTTQFKPPPPHDQLRMPEPRVPRVPVPDPTPDGPEPLPPVRETPMTVYLPDTDVVWHLPEAPPAEPQNGPRRVGDGVLPPVKTYGPTPRYTEIARKARIQGEVILEAVIDASGRITSLEVMKGLPMGLDQAALEAVGRWRFEPATYNGRPVPVIYQVSIFFWLT